MSDATEAAARIREALETDSLHRCFLDIETVLDALALRVVAAAYRARSGLVFSLPAPLRHSDVLVAAENVGMAPYLRSAYSGFLLSDGTFADRRRAFEVATAAGQVRERLPGQYAGPELYSEDVW